MSDVFDQDAGPERPGEDPDRAEDPDQEWPEPQPDPETEPAHGGSTPEAG
jgi:hypothetical protein